MFSKDLSIFLCELLVGEAILPSELWLVGWLLRTYLPYLFKFCVYNSRVDKGQITRDIEFETSKESKFHMFIAFSREGCGVI